MTFARVAAALARGLVSGLIGTAAMTLSSTIEMLRARSGVRGICIGGNVIVRIGRRRNLQPGRGSGAADLPEMQV